MWTVIIIFTCTRLFSKCFAGRPPGETFVGSGSRTNRFQWLRPFALRRAGPCHLWNGRSSECSENTTPRQPVNTGCSVPPAFAAFHAAETLMSSFFLIFWSLPVQKLVKYSLTRILQHPPAGWNLQR